MKKNTMADKSKILHKKYAKRREHARINNPKLDYWTMLKECIAAHKERAIRNYKGVSKKDHISDAVGALILMNLNQMKPVPRLFMRLIKNERISFNMILDSIGECGNQLGAVAYQLAEQLEIELPDNNIQMKEKPIVSYINGQELPDLNTDNIKISEVYHNYFIKHHPSMFLQNGYLFERIRDTRDEYEAKFAGHILTIQVGCNNHDNLLMDFIHDCLLNIYEHGVTGTEIEILQKFHQGYKTTLDEELKNLNEKEQRHLITTVAVLSTSIKLIKELNERTKQ